jgi:hypothetical protein
MTLYALFAVSAIYGNKSAWIFLLIDVMFGLMSFIIHHYRNGDFAKLL